MTTLRDKIAATLNARYKESAGFHIEAADAIIALLMDSVKPLEWDKHPDEQEWYAKLKEQDGDTFERGYMVLPVQSHFTLYDGFTSRARVLGHFTIAEEAKAAAQADYERRILSPMGLDQ